MKNLQNILEKDADHRAALEKESDRGLVLIIASELDERLKKLHINRISGNTSGNRKLANALVLSPFAPVFTFAARMKVAYAYGLIDKDIFESLEALRVLRNYAAHSTGTFSLRKSRPDDLYRFLEWIMSFSLKDLKGDFAKGIETLQQHIRNRDFEDDSTIKTAFILSASMLSALFPLYELGRIIKDTKKKKSEQGHTTDRLNAGN